jgi:hypothetical protein
MPSTNDSRAIKIRANANKLMLIGGSVLIAGLIIYFLGCNVGFLPVNICGTSNLAADIPSLTPVPTQTPLSLVIAPTVEQLPACGLTLDAAPPACGSVMWSGVGQPQFSCNADGTSNFTLKFLVNSHAAAVIMEKTLKGTPLETNPAGACMWSSVEAADIEGYSVATLSCNAPGGLTVKILENIGGETCNVTDPCPNGYTVELSQLESDGKFYCVPEGQPATSASCAPGTFIDEMNQCCSQKPANSTSFTCINPQVTNEGFSCDVEYLISLEALKSGFTMPVCSQPDRPRPENDNEEPRPEPICTPDSTGSGCP